MANKIILKKSSVASKVPLATDLEIGEIAVNLADQKLYSKNASGTVIKVGDGTATGTVTSVSGTGSYGGLTLSGTVTTSGNLTLGGTPTGSWPISVTGSSASTTGNAATATTLQTARTINGVSFNGSANITVTANTTNTLTLGSYLTGTSFNGSSAVTATVDATTAATGNKIVARDANGDTSVRYLNSSYVNMSHSAATRNTDTVFYSSTDAYIRKNTAAGFRTSLGVPYAGASGAIVENTNTISSNYTMTTGSNGMSAGPITIATGVTVTVPTGSTWVIV